MSADSLSAPASTTICAPHNTRLPDPFAISPASSLIPITQGAEALVFKTTFLSTDTSVALKVRPPKPWRHASLDRRLTRQRILAEARVLVKCRRDGILVPAVLGLDWERGWLVCEWIEGVTVKEGIRRWGVAASQPQDRGNEEELKALLAAVGQTVGKLHSVGVVHGDLTTSNMMIRARPQHNAVKAESTELSPLDGAIVLIDFGLATQAVQDEERAVDLYVLERAFGSTHPKEEHLFEVVLNSYATSFKGAASALRRLDDVRLRGRKKSMIG